jgi:hypothetical protein
MQEVDLSLDGTLAPVPRNRISISRPSIDLVEGPVGLGLFLEFFVMLFAEVDLACGRVLEAQRGFRHLLDVEGPFSWLVAAFHAAYLSLDIMICQCHALRIVGMTYNDDGREPSEPTRFIGSRR